jgi:ATP sulfurylase
MQIWQIPIILPVDNRENSDIFGKKMSIQEKNRVVFHTIDNEEKRSVWIVNKCRRA